MQCQETASATNVCDTIPGGKVKYGTESRLAICAKNAKVRYNVAGNTRYELRCAEAIRLKANFQRWWFSVYLLLASMLHFPSLAFAFIIVIGCTLGTTPFRDFLLYFVKHFLRRQCHAIFARVEHVGIGKHAH